MPAGRRDEIRRMHARALGGEIVPRFMTLQVRSDGTEIAVSMTILPMRHGDGPISNVAFIATAIGKQTARPASPVRAMNRIHPRHALALSTR